MSRPRGMISPSGRGILSSRGLVSPTRWAIDDYDDDEDGTGDDYDSHYDGDDGGLDNDLNNISWPGVVLRVLRWKERHQDTGRGFPECPRWRDPECHTGEQGLLAFQSKTLILPFQGDGHGDGGQSDGVNYRSCKQPFSCSFPNVNIKFITIFSGLLRRRLIFWLKLGCWYLSYV